MKILIIGGGNMGAAIAQSLKNNLKLSNIAVCEKDKLKLKFFKTLKIKTYTSLSKKTIKEAEILIIAVKPQSIKELCFEIKPWTQNQLIISIAAGVTLKNLETNLNSNKIVRVMPNTPALIGEGVSGWIALKGVREKDKKILKQILSSFGSEIEIKKEDQINAVTALSGCGPAYVFYFLQSLIEGAKRIGLNNAVAKKLAFQTFLGATKLAQNSNKDLQKLINNVASKGGSTEAALKIFDQKKLDQIVEKAMDSAYLRAKQLNIN